MPNCRSQQPTFGPAPRKRADLLLHRCQWWALVNDDLQSWRKWNGCNNAAKWQKGVRTSSSHWNYNALLPLLLQCPWCMLIKSCIIWLEEHWHIRWNTALPEAPILMYSIVSSCSSISIRRVCFHSHPVFKPAKVPKPGSPAVCEAHPPVAFKVCLFPGQS